MSKTSLHWMRFEIVEDLMKIFQVSSSYQSAWEWQYESKVIIFIKGFSICKAFNTSRIFQDFQDSEYFWNSAKTRERVAFSKNLKKFFSTYEVTLWPSRILISDLSNKILPLNHSSGLVCFKEISIIIRCCSQIQTDERNLKPARKTFHISDFLFNPPYYWNKCSSNVTRKISSIPKKISMWKAKFRFYYFSV